MIFIRLENNANSNNFIRLDEAKRLELVSMARGSRYDSRATKGIKYISTNIDNILGGKSQYLDVTIQVSRYITTIRFENFIKYLVEGIERYVPGRDKLSVEYNNLSKSRRKSAIASGVINAIDNAEVRVNCDCPDFKYRYSYKATVNNYNFGFTEDRVPEKTNPNLVGSTCKHLVGVLTATSKWTSKVITDVMKSIDWESTILDDYKY